jgi:nitroimidazol reductase NimA-like FMN-containing flavoprotein (pyridoxamine 5'-phosphate oxidase superfamily)
MINGERENARMSDSKQAEFAATPRNQVKRLAERGQYDKESVYRIVDEALYCHVGFVQDGQPFVLPTIHARVDDTLILHGAKASRLLKVAAAGQALCVTVTLLDGLVFARSVFHHSMNYRSAVLFGSGRPARDDAEKMWGLEAITEHIARGRWEDARKPNPRELNATAVVLVDIESASAKARSGPPKDDEEDYNLPVWGGVLPLELRALEPIADEHTGEGMLPPDYIRRYRRGG